MNDSLLVAPESMYGGGVYSFESVKEIAVTNNFKSLRKDQKQCQSIDTFEKCTTDQLMMKIKQNCNCYPYELKTTSNENEVSTTTIKCLLFFSFFNL